MKIKKILLGTMICGASLFAASAFAADIDNTFTVDLASDDAGGFNAHFGNNFSSTAMSETFTDKYLFSLPTGFDSAASVTSSFLQSSTIKDLLITGFSVVQYDPVSNAILHTYGGSNITPGTLHPTDHWELTATGLSAGSYYVEVDGKVVGTGGGAYGSDLVISTSPVPEPTTFAMLAGGLALLSGVVRRQKSGQA